ncbi:MAG: homoserine dehydrogenase [Myxococcota bacterium]|nr:homoserine dehydrogenase [Deltaproteobacteria bacterium]MCP4239238.1 homoserine dehydrogenase [bacterium]MDP6075901.1 homoserine dehydrogenase [Myxococcota bacterium]MDP7076454.1 homoserine dehydrogenase [Myxococcota bacterium]MDP7298041.1 homoserine dehydrogenase [Myxococcota bacterium]
MSDRRAIGVGLIGFGTIGTGVVKVLRRNADVIEQRLGAPLRLLRIADLDTETDRGVDLEGIRFDADAEGLVADPAVDIVVELIGGIEAARRLILRSVEGGKHVVTANKALLALHSAEIFGQAARRGVDVAFEASVGGGIPILRSVREGLAANHIEAIYGILNGTTNYVLSEMEETGEDFAVVLKRAQDLGYAEADPSVDVDGGDAAHKLTLLAAMCFGAELTCKEVPTEGIRGLAPIDFEASREFGYRIKLLGIAKARREPGSERIEARVHPTLVPVSSLLARVDGAMNAVAVIGDAVGETLFYGAGAGELPTASAVVGDLMEIARELRRGNAGRVAPLSYVPEMLEPKPLVPLGELHGRFYLRFTAVDRPGVLAHLAGVLGEHEIGIESVMQKGRGGARESVPVIVLTHPAGEAAVRAALDHIDELEDVTAPTRLLRIEQEL